MKKNILLIGGSYGIGQEIIHLLKDSYTIHSASRSTPTPSEAVTYHQFDVLTDSIATLDLPEKIHGFVYCPGTINLKPFKMMPIAQFQKDMDVNFMSLVKVVQELMPNFKAAEQSSLVFFSSVAVQTGMPYHTSIAAAKGAIEGFAKALAAEYAPSLRVNVIAPSLTDTPLAKRLLNTDEKKLQMGERHPLKRIGNSKDIATAAKFLLTEDSSWITGQVLGVDGGLSTLNIQ